MVYNVNFHPLFLDIAPSYLITFRLLCGAYATLASNHGGRPANFSGGAQNLTVPVGGHSYGPGRNRGGDKRP